ncbi:hypothetical protein HanIR_Chr12g0597751 [Helianthus annuus]|nr:hypothetical protein HanIR_Chr12g0597751 [Helianthus annuus]
MKKRKDWTYEGAGEGDLRGKPLVAPVEVVPFSDCVDVDFLRVVEGLFRL